MSETMQTKILSRVPVHYDGKKVVEGQNLPLIGERVLLEFDYGRDLMVGIYNGKHPFPDPPKDETPPPVPTFHRTHETECQLITAWYSLNEFEYDPTALPESAE